MHNQLFLYEAQFRSFSAHTESGNRGRFAERDGSGGESHALRTGRELSARLRVVDHEAGETCTSCFLFCSHLLHLLYSYIMKSSAL